MLQLKRRKHIKDPKDSPEPHGVCTCACQLEKVIGIILLPSGAKKHTKEFASIAFTQRYSTQSKHTSTVNTAAQSLQHWGHPEAIASALPVNLPLGTEARPPVLHRRINNKFHTVMQAEERSWSACHIGPCRGDTLALSNNSAGLPEGHV